MQRRSRGINTGLILLLSQIFHVGINNIPPVTLATLALNIWFFLNPQKPLYSSCLSVEKCYQQKDWQRLLLSPLHHADDWHLYFNMASMLWKGINLERRLGSRWFAYVITTFSVLTGVVYLLLQFAVAEFMDEPDFKRSCAVGFSGVLFALKVLNNHYCPGGFVNILGFPVPNRFACWVELVAIHLFSPGTSFAGHLAGILVGLMYTQGPLKKIMEACAGSSGYQDYYPHGRPDHYEEAPRNYDTYTAGLSEEEQLERALQASLWDRDGVSLYRPGWSGVAQSRLTAAFTSQFKRFSCLPQRLKFMSFVVGTWMKLETIILSKLSQGQKTKHRTFSLIGGN
ncbi:rhomboid-related protein 4 isoform X3 [Gorilla gorilla gorilla]|uniref:rhomboid-related protein 4 isoform X3 n=1 Tax=Gorilla gorilla gorilla TaxID=9595 RepID=UPI00300933F3